MSEYIIKMDNRNKHYIEDFNLQLAALLLKENCKRQAYCQMAEHDCIFVSEHGACKIKNIPSEWEFRKAGEKDDQS